RVGVGDAVQNVVAGIAPDEVRGVFVTGAVEIEGALQLQVLENANDRRAVLREAEADRAAHGIVATAVEENRFAVLVLAGDHIPHGIAGAVDDIAVVALAADHRVVPRATVELIVAFVAEDEIIKVVARGAAVVRADQVEHFDVEAIGAEIEADGTRDRVVA